MNKLYKSLLIIEHFGWKQDLDPNTAKYVDTLLEKSKHLTDDELSPEEWEVVRLVEKILDDKFAARKKEDFDNN